MQVIAPWDIKYAVKPHPYLPFYCCEDGRVFLKHPEGYRVCATFVGKRDKLLQTCQKINGATRNFSVGKLVAEAFLENPDPRMFKYLIYLDGDFTNTAAWNLQWTNRLGVQNSKYGTQDDHLNAKTLGKKDSVFRAAFHVYDLQEDTDLGLFYNLQDAAQALDVSRASISRALNGESLKIGGRYVLAFHE